MIKRYTVLLIALLCFSTTVHAAIPQKSYIEIKDGRHFMIKTYEASVEEDPSKLREDKFELDGYSYAYFETTSEDVIIIENRQETMTETISTESDNISDILQQLAPDVGFDADGFTGTLTLEHSSIQTVVEGYTSKAYTLSDSVRTTGLSHNDPSSIAKTTNKNGVTLKLKDIEWVVESSETVDYSTVPTKYTAIAYYTGTYSKQVPTGYVTTALYTGEVSKSSVDKVIYTIAYLGEKLPEPTPEPTPEPIPVETEEPNKQIALVKWIAGSICLLMIIGGALAFYKLYYNVFVYIKDADEYQLIIKRRIKWNNPVIDLNSLEISGKEVAVNVKKNTAKKLFGRHVKTVAGGDFTMRCLVDKQDCDFWYMANIPDYEKSGSTNETK